MARWRESVISPDKGLERQLTHGACTHHANDEDLHLPIPLASPWIDGGLIEEFREALFDGALGRHIC